MIPTIKEVQRNWNVAANMYAKFIERPNMQIGLSLSRMLKLHKARNILDVGCGSGLLAMELIPSLAPGTKLTSLDISDEMIKMANQRKASLPPCHVEHQFLVGDAENLSFVPSGSIDAYLANLSLHFTPDPNKALKEAVRVLNRGGRIGFSVLGNAERCTLFKVFSDRVKEFNLEPSTKRSMFHLGDRDGLIKLAQNNGIKVDFCWVETVAEAVVDVEDLEVILQMPAHAKKLEKLDEVKRERVLEAIRRDFLERKAKFTPLQLENVLLIGRKEE